MAANPRRPLGNVPTNTSRLSLGGPAARKPGPAPGSAMKPSFANQNTRRETIATGPNRQSLGARGRSSLGGRQSLSAMNRSTISYSLPGGTDPRPIKDKNYQRNCATSLIKFILLKGYDRPIQPKVLESPTRRDVFGIIEFLFRMVDPTFSLDNCERVEEEIVAMFKLVRYPFSLSPRSLVSVGTPHTWPSLLAALHWLMELVAAGHLTQPTTEPTEVFFRYLEGSYSCFLQGQDDAADLDQDLAGSFQEKAAELENERNRLEGTLREQEAEAARLRNRPNTLAEARALNSTLNSDIEKYKALCNELQVYTQKISDKSQREQQKLEQAETALAELQAEVRAYQEQIQMQQIAAVDAERLMQEKATAEESLNIVNKEKELIESNVWNKELEVSKKLEEVEVIAKRYTELATRLQLLPLGAKNCGKVDFAIAFASHSAGAEGRLAEHLHSHLKPALRTLAQDFTTQIAAAQDALLTVSAECTDVQERLNDVKDEIMALEEKLKKGDSAFKKEKERLVAQLAAVEGDVETVRSGEAEVRARAGEAWTRTEKMREQLQGEYEATESTLVSEQEELCSSIYLSLDMIAKHKAYLRDQLAHLSDWLHAERALADAAQH